VRVLRGLGDTLRMTFAGTFLELCIEMVSLELWLEMEDEHWTFLELWLKMVCVTGVSVRVVSHTEGLHSIEQSQVVANDVLILCRDYELWFVFGTPCSVYIPQYSYFFFGVN